MKKIEEQFDKIVKFSRATALTWTFVLLLMGFASMATSLVSQYMMTGWLMGGGISGMLFAYFGIGLMILATDRRSRIAKTAAIIALPLIVFLAAKFYVS